MFAGWFGTMSSSTLSSSELNVAVNNLLKLIKKLPTCVQDSDPKSSENPSIKPQFPQAFKSPHVLPFNSHEYTFVLSVEQVVSWWRSRLTVVNSYKQLKLLLVCPLNETIMPLFFNRFLYYTTQKNFVVVGVYKTIIFKKNFNSTSFRIKN